VLALLVAVLMPFFRYVVAERVGVIVLSALVCHTGWHWMIDRATVLTTIALAPADLIEIMRWTMASAIAASAAVFLVGFGRRLFEWGRTESPVLEGTIEERA
jgi:divalent metal cation (Fe/Co/Zn/Cd) transporter